MRRAPELVAALSETLATAIPAPRATFGGEIHCRFCGKRTRAGDDAMLRARFERHLRSCSAARTTMKAEAGE